MQQHGTRALSVRERAYIHIQRLIADGTLAAGGGVSELVLAKELGSSRTLRRVCCRKAQPAV
jgi:DNA-binding GntR family transcriptional regulator